MMESRILDFITNHPGLRVSEVVRRVARNQTKREEAKAAIRNLIEQGKIGVDVEMKLRAR